MLVLFLLILTLLLILLISLRVVIYRKKNKERLNRIFNSINPDYKNVLKKYGKDDEI